MVVESTGETPRMTIPPSCPIERKLSISAIRLGVSPGARRASPRLYGVGEKKSIRMLESIGRRMIGASEYGIH
jgi:hypothetical protein